MEAGNNNTSNIPSSIYRRDISQEANRNRRNLYSGRQNTAHLQARIAQNRSTIYSREGYVLSSNSNQATNEISENTTNTQQPQYDAARQEKLDRVLNLIEEITGEDISEAELNELLNDGKTTFSQKPSSDNTISGSELAQSKSFNLASQDLVDPKEEKKFNLHRRNVNDSQITGFQNLLNEWVAHGSSDPNARSNMAQLRAKINLSRAGAGFHQSRAMAWQEKDAYQLKDGDNYNTASKINNYRKDTVKLESQVSEWMSVEDDSGQARAQVAQIRAKLFMNDNVEKFLTGENDFWRLEQGAQYKTEDKDQVQQIYGNIEDLQNRMEKSIMAESSEDGGALLLELAKEKKQLNELRLNPDKNLLIMNPGGALGANSAEEQAFASFKTEFYQSQMMGLENLYGEWDSVQGSQDTVKDQKAQIREQMGLVGDGINFWHGENKFWSEISDMGPIDFNKVDDAYDIFQISFLEGQVTGLENLMDEWISVEDDSGQAKQQQNSIRSQLNQAKSEILALYKKIT
jgi:hypothetical protein